MNITRRKVTPSNKPTDDNRLHGISPNTSQPDCDRRGQVVPNNKPTLIAHRKKPEETSGSTSRGARLPYNERTYNGHTETHGYVIDCYNGKKSTSYAIDCFNAILSQSVKAAMADDEECAPDQADATQEENCACNRAANAAADRDGCDCDDPATDGTDTVNHPSHYCQGEHDMVNHPAHYCAGGIECIDAIQAAVTGLSGMEAVCTGHVIRYIWRWKHKNGLQDLQKARFYLNKLILLMERKSNDD